MAYNETIYLGNLNETDHLEDMDIDEKIRDI
jgi:hypothetical protein